MDPKQYYPEFLKTPLSRQPCERLIVSPRRQILIEGALMMYDLGKLTEMFIILFDDMLLITRRKKTLSKKVQLHISKSRNLDHLFFPSPEIDLGRKLVQSWCQASWCPHRRQHEVHCLPPTVVIGPFFHSWSQPHWSQHRQIRKFLHPHQPEPVPTDRFGFHLSSWIRTNQGNLSWTLVLNWS